MPTRTLSAASTDSLTPRVQTAFGPRRRRHVQQRASHRTGWHNHDLSVFKSFPIKATQSFQFRWEIYNLFNQVKWDEIDRTAQFDAAGNQVDAAFGRPTSARNERRMQLSIRYIF